MKKIFIIFLLIIVALLAYIAFKPRVSPSLNQNVPSGHTIVNTNPNGSDYTPPVIMSSGRGEITDLVSFSIEPGQEISGIVTANGVIQGGYFFEANIVTELADKSYSKIVMGHGTATTDWMTTGPVSFTTTLDTNTMPKGPGFIILIQDDPSDGASGKLKRIEIPVIFK